MTAVLRVALLGFSAIERTTLLEGFQQAETRRPAYVLEADLEGADLILADAEHGAAVRLVLATERLADTVFIGQSAPGGAAACVARPIDVRHLMREFDAMLGARSSRSPTPAPSPPATRPAAIDGAPDNEPAQGGEPTALIVDDSDTARHSLAQRLHAWGFSVDRAANSSQALALLARRDFDSVFINVDLGPASALDGLGLCHQLKRQAHLTLGRPLWVALVTELDGAIDRVRGTLAGCDAYLVMPLDEVELARSLWHQGWVQALPRHAQPAPPAGDGRSAAPRR